MKTSVNGGRPATAARPNGTVGGTGPSATTGAGPATGASRPVNELVHEATELASRLVRQEVQLAKAELTEKGKRAGLGGGLFSGAGLLAIIGLQAFVAAAIAGLALVMPLWAAALVAGGALMLIAAVLALVGRGQLRKAGSPVPEQAIATTRTDIDVIKERAHR
ncbi:phage holin family protein [Kitasatospora sp. NBC_01539]|uniref:phage holin family protein n=1 Tax=Kitasatospora sp. NBC_01539 TaxID=2903577 RepID=UPI0038602E4C